jgi:hypothetical protein
MKLAVDPVGQLPAVDRNPFPDLEQIVLRFG